MQRPAHPCEYIAGWSRNIPTDEHLFVVLPTEEDNGQRTYNYPVDVNRTQDQWSTIFPVLMRAKTISVWFFKGTTACLLAHSLTTSP